MSGLSYTQVQTSGFYQITKATFWETESDKTVVMENSDGCVEYFGLAGGYEFSFRRANIREYDMPFKLENGDWHVYCSVESRDPQNGFGAPIQFKELEYQKIVFESR